MKDYLDISMQENDIATMQDIFEQENNKKRNDMKIEVIKTAIRLLEEDLPKNVRGAIEHSYCKKRLTFLKEQSVRSYDSTFCRSLYAFLSNFVEVFYTYNPRFDTEPCIVERKFLYKEILDQVENFIHDL